ncbi:MAG: 23S rRNA (pseudouridine(1915)-N(3))-methyltransferase RlmH, partial [Pseudomonadota bacterium]|nr:23S rRNA (pseudouridine(1915)-N(3))-methyltransferase RlmH [Pseudomonadota bacterium]
GGGCRGGACSRRQPGCGNPTGWRLPMDARHRRPGVAERRQPRRRRRGRNARRGGSGGGREAEGKAILNAVPAGAKVLRLDEHGPALTSVEFSQQIAALRDAGTSEFCVLIGGAEGYSEPVRKAFPQTLALGPQTWPHRLVKAMITEQLYRAVSLLAGLPYHKA